MTFIACHRDDYLMICGESLDAVLTRVADINEPRFGEDVVIWLGGRVAAVHRGGRDVIRFDALAAPVALAPEVPVDSNAGEDIAIPGQRRQPQ
jgi:hypothetical protein